MIYIATFRVLKNKNYTVIPNGFLHDSNLSLKAKGLLAYFLSKPDDWDFYATEIQKNCKDGRDSITTAINELESRGYIRKEVKRCKGKFSGGYDYSVFETPQVQGENEPNSEIPESEENRIGKKPNREKQLLLNTDIKLNTDINNIYTHWNSKKIINHKSLTQEIKKTIEKVLNKYTENEIIQGIDIYSEILKSEFYFNYKWSLSDFLNRKNGISTFTDEGTNKTNYEDWKMKGGKSDDRNPSRSTRYTPKSFEGNKLKDQQEIDLTEEERRKLDELE